MKFGLKIRSQKVNFGFKKLETKKREVWMFFSNEGKRRGREGKGGREQGRKRGKGGGREREEVGKRVERGGRREISPHFRGTYRVVIC